MSLRKVAVMGLATLVLQHRVGIVQSLFFICPAPCEAMYLPIDMQSLDDCLCPSGTHPEDFVTKLHDNNNAEGANVIYQCPPHSSARMLHPMSFADCECEKDYSRDDHYKRCTEGGFLCFGKYAIKPDVEVAKSLTDCTCIEPYTKDDATGMCMLTACPRAGNYIQKQTAVTVKTLADCTCTDPLVKNEQSGECVTRDSFQCPKHSKVIRGRNPKKFSDCKCDWGFVRKLVHGVGKCVREAAIYHCPPNSLPRSDLTQPPRSFADCECLEDHPLQRNEVQQSCDRYNAAGVPAKPMPITCPRFSRALAPVVYNFKQCKCINGYGMKDPEKICVRLSSYRCPPHSHMISKKVHVEQSFQDCACAKGYFRDEETSSCRQLRLTTGNGCPPNAFLVRWPLQLASNCRCVHDFAPNTNGKEMTCHEPKNYAFMCPPNSFLSNWPLASNDDCTCAFGFEKKSIPGRGGMGCAESTDSVHQHVECAHPMVRDPMIGDCRLPLEEVKLSSSDALQTGQVVFKGIEYTFVLVEDNVMVIQGDVAIGELANTQDLEMIKEPLNFDEYVLHGYYNDERDHRWKDATMCYECSQDAWRFRKTLESAMEKITYLTGFRFRQCASGIEGSCSQDKECHDYVRFTETRSSCWSYVGRVGNKQSLGVSSDCGVGNLIHVLLHAIGLHHTMDRPDRDDHVRIAWECIPEDKRSYFVVEDTAENKNRKFASDVPYDFYSIMHHPSDAFVKAHTSSKRPHDSNTPPHIPQWCRSVFPVISDVFDRDDVLTNMGQRRNLAVTDVHYVWAIYPSLKDDDRLRTAIDRGHLEVHQSRLHLPRDVSDDLVSDDMMEFHAQSHSNSFASRLVYVLGSFAVLSAFAAMAFFVSVELKNRALRTNQSFYSDSFLEKNLFD